MGALLSEQSTSSISKKPSSTSSNKKKNPWYQKKQTRVTILISFAILAFIAIFFISLEIRMDAPILLMTTHNYENIVAFNANTGAFITTALLDLTPQKNMDFTSMIKQKKIQFRGILTKDNQITVANGEHDNHFIATFNCGSNPGWRLDSYFGNDTEFLTHPYGITWDPVHRWWFIVTQITDSLFIYNESGSPLSLPGMKEHYPGAVFTLLNHSNGYYMDTFIKNSKPFNKESSKKKKLDLDRKNTKYGLRGVAFDSYYGLIFVAAEIYGNILVFDINHNFSNVYNISLPNGAEPISVMIGEPYFKYTLFITDRSHSTGIYAIRYTPNDYNIWWTSEKVSFLQHATGIAISADSLFVLSQSSHAILRYNPHNGKYLSQVVHFLEDDPSGIITHGGVSKMGNPVENQHVMGEQLLYIPPGQKCSVE